jgi:hypothetical protein
MAVQGIDPAAEASPQDKTDIGEAVDVEGLPDLGLGIMNSCFHGVHGGHPHEQKG